MLQSLLPPQNLMRVYGNTVVKYKARLLLPVAVRQEIGSMKTNELGFKDPKDVSVKANGLALQVQVTALDHLLHAVFEN